jgi:hypothetical protein
MPLNKGTSRFRYCGGLKFVTKFRITSALKTQGARDGQSPALPEHKLPKRLNTSPPRGSQFQKTATPGQVAPGEILVMDHSHGDCNLSKLPASFRDLFPSRPVLPSCSTESSP